MTAALINLLLCDRCGRCPLVGDGRCTTPYPPGMQGAVQLRHRASVQLAAERARYDARRGAAT